MALVLFGLGWNLMGDALRDIMDPRLAAGVYKNEIHRRFLPVTGKNLLVMKSLALKRGILFFSSLTILCQSGYDSQP